MRNRDWLTIEEARRRLDYNPLSGDLTWKVLHNTKRIGAVARSLDVAGYVQVNLAGTMLKGHRLAWFLHYGQWPDGQIDHVNGIRSDNRIANLRCVSHQVNAQNQRNGSRSSATGLIGVYVDRRHGKPWVYRAKIQVNKRQIHLGGFPTPEAAHLAYVTAKRRLHSGCAI